MDPEGGDQSAGLLQDTLQTAARTAGTRMQQEALPALLVEAMSKLPGDPDQPVIVGSVWNPDHPPLGRGAEA